MAGTRIGGLKAAQKNLKRDPDFYKRIGSKGGSNGHTGGFATNVDCNCGEFPYRHYITNCAGAKGGRISRRRKKDEQTVEA